MVINRDGREYKISVRERTSVQYQREVIHIILITQFLFSFLFLLTKNKNGIFNVFHHLIFQIDEEHNLFQEMEDITVTYARCQVCNLSKDEHLLLLCDGIIGQNVDGSSIRCNAACAFFLSALY